MLFQLRAEVDGFHKKWHSVWWVQTPFFLASDSESIQSEDIKFPLLEISDFLLIILLVNNLLAKVNLINMSFMNYFGVCLFIDSSSQTPTWWSPACFEMNQRASSKVQNLFLKYSCLIHDPEIKQHPKCFSFISYHNISYVLK